MRYWRCRLPGWLDVVLWPMVGHLIVFKAGYACCERCPWREPLPVFFG